MERHEEPHDFGGKQVRLLHLVVQVLVPVPAVDRHAEHDVAHRGHPLGILVGIVNAAVGIVKRGYLLLQRALECAKRARAVLRVGLPQVEIPVGYSGGAAGHPAVRANHVPHEVHAAAGAQPVEQGHGEEYHEAAGSDLQELCFGIALEALRVQGHAGHVDKHVEEYAYGDGDRGHPFPVGNLVLELDAIRALEARKVGVRKPCHEEHGGQECEVFCHLDHLPKP